MTYEVSDLNSSILPRFGTSQGQNKVSERCECRLGLVMPDGGVGQLLVVVAHPSRLVVHTRRPESMMVSTFEVER